MSDGTVTKSTSTVGEVFRVFLRLGLTSFGGPVAHIGFFHAEFVQRRRWLDEADFADLVALCQFLPGPASSQFGFAVGLQRAGWAGALAAWAGFTLPSALVMILFALGLTRWSGVGHAGWIHGLKLAAVAVVAQAVWTMADKLCRRWELAALALAGTVAMLLWPSSGTQLAVIGIAAALARWLTKTGAEPETPTTTVRTGRPTANLFLVFAGLLAGLPLLAALWPAGWLMLLDRFYRAGALVFGGGHVVLPLLQSAVVTPGWVTPDEFLAGYGVAQALPGPLFAFAAYLGAVTRPEPNGWLGGALGLLAVFLPGLLLVAGAWPWWERLRRFPALRRALTGANAAVVGILLAALISPIATGTLRTAGDGAVALLAWSALGWRKVPVWAVVGLCAAIVGLAAT